MPEEPRIGMFVAASLVLLVAPAADNATYQLFMLGLLFNGLTVYVGICYALMGRMLGSWLR
jgi:threonine/homoserine/homoserine lactone efflux protein